MTLIRSNYETNLKVDINKTNWFEQNPKKSIFIVVIFLVFILEVFMHLLFFMDLLPKNIIYMTRLEKQGYGRDIGKIVYEDGIPRRGEGFVTYNQRGIPNQFVEFNSDGMRIDNNSNKNADIIIGMFGDSYTDALQVSKDEVYTAILEDNLLKKGCNIDVRNYGIGATGTSVQYLRYKQQKQKGDTYNYVVLTMFIGNDIFNNSYDMDTLMYKSYEQYPYLIYQDAKLHRQDYISKNEPVFVQSIKNILYNYSHIANVVYNFNLIYKAENIAAESARAGNPLDRTGDKLIMDGVYDDTPDEKWKQAWTNTEEIIKAWKNDTDKSGEKFIIVLLTESKQLAPDYQNPSSLDLDYPSQRITSFAVSLGIDVVDFLPYARSKVLENDIEYPFISWEYDGHYSQKGHEFLSELLLQYFEKILSC